MLSRHVISRHFFPFETFPVMSRPNFFMLLFSVLLYLDYIFVCFQETFLATEFLTLVNYCKQSDSDFDGVLELLQEVNGKNCRKTSILNASSDEKVVNPCPENNKQMMLNSTEHTIYTAHNY